MVIPQALVPIGLSIMVLLVGAASPDRRRPRRRPTARAIDGSMTADDVHDSGLRLFRSSRDPSDSRAADLSRAAGDVPGGGAVRRRRADRSRADLSVRRARQSPAAGGAVLRAGRRDHGARRHRAPRRGLGHLGDRRHTRLARGDDGRGLRAVRRDGAYGGRHGGGGRPDDLSVAARRRLQRALLGRLDRLVGRHRRGHSAVDRDDPLFGVGAAIGDCAVHRRHPAEPADRLGRCALCDDLRPRQDGAADRQRALGCDLVVDQGGELVDQHHRRHLRRHLWRRLHADRGRGRRRDLFAVRDHGGASRDRSGAISGASSRARCS